MTCCNVIIPNNKIYPYGRVFGGGGGGTPEHFDILVIS